VTMKMQCQASLDSQHLQAAVASIQQDVNEQHLQPPLQETGTLGL